MHTAARHAFLFLLTVTALVVVPVGQAAASQPGSPCSASAVSAMNEYCENVPSSGGGNQAGPGTPALASHLPPSIVTALRGPRPGPGTRGVTATSATSLSERGPQAGALTAQRASQRVGAPRRTRSELLTLPAPGRNVPIAGAALPHADSFSLLGGLLAVLAGVSAAAGAVAVLARRRRDAS